MFWGSLIGRLFMMPLVGAAVGAASGALSGRFTDVGIKVLAALQGSGGKVLRSSFDETKEEALRAALVFTRQMSSQRRRPSSTRRSLSTSWPDWLLTGVSATTEDRWESPRRAAK